jgi:capsular exopolysaccharide synthesis family protein
MDIANTLKQVALSLFVRRKMWIILATVAALALLLPAAYLASREPPRYQTTATIFLESKTPSLLFQEFSPFRPLAVQLAILQSRVLAQSVFEALPRAAVEDLIKNPYGNDLREDLQNWFLRLRGVQPTVESPESRALAELRNARVAFIPQGGTGLVQVRADASNPRVALDIVNAYVEVMIARTRSFNVDDAKSTREYLSQQGSQVGEALQVSDKAFREFTLTKGALKLPERVSDMATRLSELEGTVAEVQANKNLSQVRLTALRAKLDAMPAPAKSATPTAPPVQTQRLRARLAAFEAQLADARLRYTDEHPRIRLLRQQIAEVQRELGDAVKDSTSADLAGSSVPTEDRSAFAEMVAALDTSVVSLSGQEVALREQIAALRKNLSGLSKDELEYRRLASDVDTNRRLGSMIQEKLAASRISQTGEMNVVKIVDPASTPIPAVNQKRLKYLAIALAFGLVLGVAGPGLAEYVNRPLQSEQAIRQSTGLPILAIVPQVESRRPVFTSGERQPQDPSQQDYVLFVDAFRRLRVELQMLAEEMPLRRILVASALPKEGKSTVTYNLALAFGEIGQRVIIADADFHRPTLHRTAKAKNEKGFTDLLAGTSALPEATAMVSEQVRLAPRGTALSIAARVGLGTKRLTEVLVGMEAEAEYVLIDSSPILLVPDNLYMASAADGIILVVDSGSTRPRDLLRTKEVLERTGTPIVGVVLNRAPLKRTHYYYKQYVTYYTMNERSS